MRLTSLVTCFLAFLTPLASSTKLIQSNSLNLCGDAADDGMSNFTATYFSVMFTPNNKTLSFSFDGVSSISGKVTAELVLKAYGYTALRKELNPCEMKLQGLCPMHTGKIDVKNVHLPLPEDVVSKVPNIAYTVPDLDASVRIYINSTETHKPITCIEAHLSNGKTVYQAGVGWATAIISGLGLTASAITSGLGHSNTAAHVASNALSFFGFMQSQAMIGMTAVHMPPIVESWTQNFQWSMGIIRIGFMQTICTWYQRSTGGKPSTILSDLSTTSVEVLKKRSFDQPFDMTKRSLDAGAGLMKRASGSLFKRADPVETAKNQNTVVRGIERVGFRAGIEETNIFLTGLIFFAVFVAVVMILVVLFKVICESLAKSGKMKSDKFLDFRNGWKVVARGILFRLTLIGFPQMCILCLWEFTRNDSPAEVLLAVIMLLSMVVSLGWASQKVIRLARRSVVMHKNPAYILYSDPTCLNKWGFLYVQYRATAYYFVVPVLAYILVLAMFIGLSQPAEVVQAIAFVIIQAAMLIAVSVLRPWMDKKTNIYNIAISAISFLNAIFLLVFSNVFDQPGMVTGVMGVVFFVYNAVFALVLLLLVLIASIYAIVSKNPDMRYQPMRDDRGSFIKSQSQLTTELDALGATARGDMKRSPFDDENESFSSGNGASFGHQNMEGVGTARQAPASPVDPSVPLFPSDGSSRRGPTYEDSNPFGRSPSPVPRGYTTSPINPGSTLASNTYRAQNNPSPWQRGAGYDH